MIGQDGQLLLKGEKVYPKTKAKLISIENSEGAYKSSNVEDVLDEINDKLNTKIDAIEGKQLTTADYSFEEKSKLSLIEAQANKYIHPQTHPASVIAQDTSNRFVTDSQIAQWNFAANGYVHDQILSSLVWEIQHNLNKYPSVTIVDSANSVILGDIQYISENFIIITFTSEFSGKVYLS